MKITHRLPINNWYDHTGDFMLDYPPLEAYIHYCMGIIYNLIDPYTLRETPLHYDVPVTRQVKYALRIPVIIVSLVFYYPAVIFVITHLFKEYKNYIKFLLIAVLLNMPIFTQIEHMNTQVNAPSLGFLLWSLYFLVQNHYSLCAFFFTLSVFCKQITLPSIVPITFYILSALYRDACENQKKTTQHWLKYYILQCLKLVFVGIFTILLVLLPFYNKPHGLQEMFNRVFPVGNRDLVTTAATFWTFMRHFFNQYDVPQYKVLFFKICSIVVMATSLLTAPFMFFKPKNRNVFFNIFAVCGMNMYFFGYYIHEKHLHYGYIGFLLGFMIFKNYLLSFSTIISYTLFFMAGINKNHIEYILLTSSFLYLMHVFQKEVKENESNEYLPIDQREKIQNIPIQARMQKIITNLYGKQVLYAPYFEKFVFTVCGITGVLGVFCLFSTKIRQFMEANSYYFFFDASFLMFFAVYIHMWTCLWREVFVKKDTEAIFKNSPKLK